MERGCCWAAAQKESTALSGLGGDATALGPAR